jgi:HEAT repeat protein
MSLLSFSALFSLSAFAETDVPSHLLGLTDADLVAHAWTTQPGMTRAGIPRFTDPTLYNPALTPVILERLSSGGEHDYVRLALVELLPRTGGDWDGALVDLYTTEQSADVRSVMVEVTRRAAPEDARSLLRQATDDTSALVRAAVMRTIPYVDDGAGMSAPLLAGLSDTNPEVRGFAARSAGWTGLAAAWDDLVVLLGDVEPDNRLKALRALERLDADATAKLDALDTLEIDLDPRVSRAAQQIRGR